jgi:hypothetical protein
MMNDQSKVETLLTIAGLAPPADELAEMVASYPALRAGIELLYAPEFGDAEPLLVPTIDVD